MHHGCRPSFGPRDHPDFHRSLCNCVSALRAEKYSRAQVDLMQEQETKREREQAKLRRVVSEIRCGRFRCSKAWPSLDACKGQPNERLWVGVSRGASWANRKVSSRGEVKS